MAASYPTSVKSFSAKVNGDLINATHVTDLEAEVVAVETALIAGLPVAQGGTAIVSYAVGDLLYASGPTTLSKLADVALGNVLLSGGVTTAPAWGAVNLTSAVTGTLPVANGGTGLSSIAHTVQVFTSGSGTYTLPSGCKAIWVRAVGAGGGGGGSVAGQSGGGGGAGGYTETLIASPAGTYSYAVGAGGAGGAAAGNNAGTGGGNTTFSTLTGSGGSGAAGSTTETGGLGGTASGGNVNTSGNPGSYGHSTDYKKYSAGGGSHFGGGAPVGTAALANSGAGGGGSSNGAAGNAGGSGLIIVTEYYV